MEFQFGTNWAQFSRLTGGVIGQPLAMEGTFSFFLESAFLGLFLYGEKTPGEMGALGGWLPGVPRVMDLRVLYHRRRRMDAASSGLHAPVQWRVQCFQLLGTLDQPVGADSVRTQHERSRSHRGIRDGECGRILFAAAKVRGARAHLSPGGSCRWNRRLSLAGVSQRAIYMASTWRATNR